MSHAGPTGQMPCPPGDGGPRGGCPLTSKSWYCSSVSALLATTSVRRPSRAMFPHWENTGRSQARHGLGNARQSLSRPPAGVGSRAVSEKELPPSTSSAVHGGGAHRAGLTPSPFPPHEGKCWWFCFSNLGNKFITKISLGCLPDTE